MDNFRQRQHGLADMPPSAKEDRAVVAAKTLKPYERFIRATSNTANPSFTITLAHPSECAGGTVSIRATIADAQAVTVTDPSASLGDLTLDTDDDGVILYSDGERWYVVVNEIA